MYKTDATDLNRLTPIGGRASDMRDNGTHAVSAVSVHFRDLETHLVALIRKARAAVGCVAWLTNARILEALAGLPDGCSIVVQKEDFLRPEPEPGKSWKKTLRRRYDRLGPLGAERLELGELVRRLSICSDQTIDPVRCVGNYNRDRVPAFPRMHNKFLVLGRLEDVSEYDRDFRPTSVWSGSFNFTENGTRSFENAMVVCDPDIMAAYYREWEQILALSEKLDWVSDWCEPQWRLGS